MHAIRTDRRRFATRLAQHRVPGGSLIQWPYSVRQRSKWGASILSSFVSLRTFDDRAGIYLDAPYYCYGGPHQYRRLPSLLAGRVRLCVAWGQLHAACRRVAGAVQAAFWRAALAPAEAIRRWRARRQWSRFLSEIDRIA